MKKTLLWLVNIILFGIYIFYVFIAAYSCYVNMPLFGIECYPSREVHSTYANILKNMYKKVRKNVGIGWIG